MKNSTRIQWLDISKGIGIILIVFGHCFPLSSDYCRIVYSFHVPLFFFLSGYVFSGNTLFRVFFGKRSKSLLIPYFQAFFLGLLVTIILPVWRQGLSLSGVLQDLYYGNPNNVHNSSVWFLLCLFFTTIIFFWINKLSVWLQTVIVCGVYALGVAYIYMHNYLALDRLPLDLDCVPLALVFFAIGNYCKESKMLVTVEKQKSVQVILLILSLTLLIIIYQINGYVNLHGLTIGNPVLYISGGLCGSIVVITLSMIITDFPFLRPMLLYFGQHSLLIMCTQSILIRLYIVVVDRLLSIELSLYSFNVKHGISCFVLVCFIVEPMLCLLSDKTNRLIQGCVSKHEQNTNT